MDETETQGERLQRLRSRLSVEQRTFVERYMLTHDPLGAYREAFPDEHLSARALRSKAYSLLERWYIKDYMAAMLDDEDGSPESLILTRAEIIGTLAGILRNGSARDEDRIRACQVAAKIMGAEAPERKHVEVTGKGGGPVEVRGLTTERVYQIRAVLMGVDPSQLESESIPVQIAESTAE